MCGSERIEAGTHTFNLALWDSLLAEYLCP
jgi:hypothetical protein